MPISTAEVYNGTIQGGRREASKQDDLHELLCEECQEGNPMQEMRVYQPSPQGEREQEDLGLPNQSLQTSSYIGFSD
jgi:hypothetical protein